MYTLTWDAHLGIQFQVVILTCVHSSWDAHLWFSWSEQTVSKIQFQVVILMAQYNSERALLKSYLWVSEDAWSITFLYFAVLATHDVLNPPLGNWVLVLQVIKLLVHFLKIWILSSHDAAFDPPPFLLPAFRASRQVLSFYWCHNLIIICIPGRCHLFRCASIS